ncbi:MAG TPA: hypothetical protein VKQ06_08395, partial [Gammaproteobacteria bacterium]|nr:hypothetical protein [Gammaproteobacteria bacterium]
HEIGHNFGAPHDGEEGACLNAPPGYLMASMLSPAADRFSQCSVDVISSNLASMSCLTPIPVVDLAIEARSDTATPLTETPFDFTVDVANLGLETAADTIVQLAFDPAVSVLEVAPQSGTCGPAQQNIVCDLGAVPGSSTRSIRVTARSDTPGDTTIGGSVTAADDVNTSNDAFAVSLHVAQASDLALIATPQTLRLDEASGIAVTLENRSGFAATDIAVTGSYSFGLQVEAVSYAGAACSVTAAARTFACQIADLGGFSDGTISIALRGVATGSEELMLAVSARQADPNVDDNSASIALQIIANATTPAPDGDTTQAEQGGGGGLGPAALLALLGAWRQGRRYVARQKANFS